MGGSKGLSVVANIILFKIDELAISVRVPQFTNAEYAYDRQYQLMRGRH